MIFQVTSKKPSVKSGYVDASSAMVSFNKDQWMDPANFEYAFDLYLEYYQKQKLNDDYLRLKYSPVANYSHANIITSDSDSTDSSHVRLKNKKKEGGKKKKKNEHKIYGIQVNAWTIDSDLINQQTKDFILVLSDDVNKLSRYDLNVEQLNLFCNTSVIELFVVSVSSTSSKIHLRCKTLKPLPHIFKIYGEIMVSGIDEAIPFHGEIFYISDSWALPSSSTLVDLGEEQPMICENNSASFSEHSSLTCTLSSYLSIPNETTLLEDGKYHIAWDLENSPIQGFQLSIPPADANGAKRDGSSRYVACAEKTLDSCIWDIVCVNSQEGIYFITLTDMKHASGPKKLYLSAQAVYPRDTRVKDVTYVCAHESDADGCSLWQIKKHSEIDNYQITLADSSTFYGNEGWPLVGSTYINSNFSWVGVVNHPVVFSLFPWKIVKKN